MRFFFFSFPFAGEEQWIIWNLHYTLGIWVSLSLGEYYILTRDFGHVMSRGNNAAWRRWIPSEAVPHRWMIWEGTNAAGLDGNALWNVFCVACFGIKYANHEEDFRDNIQGLDTRQHAHKTGRSLLTKCSMITSSNHVAQYLYKELRRNSKQQKQRWMK